MLDETSLMHIGIDYNPVKAHEYYLRNRNLKGRDVSVNVSPIHSNRKLETTTIIQPKKSANHLRLVSKGRQSLVQQRAEKHQADLQLRLDGLRELLSSMIKKAKTNSSSNTKSSAKTTSTTTTNSNTKVNLTPTQKYEAAVRSKKSYEQNKHLKGPSTKAQTNDVTIEQVRERIKKIRAELKAAVEKARSQSNSKTA